jgi:hypothetical protein
VVLVLLSGTAQGQTATVLRKDLKRDFGAIGDGKTNDQAAFARAAAFFNQRATTGATGPAELRIPKGVYIVGQQTADGKGENVLALTGCRNLAIIGEDSATTEIRFADGMRYGAFSPTTGQAFESPSAYFTDWSYGAFSSTMIVLQKCDQVRVANLALNGNSARLALGGHWGDTGIQLPQDGIFVQDSRRITMRNLAIHHFGRDAIQVLNRLAKSVDDPNRESIVLENSTCDYNGRQGLSLTGVNGFRAVNCSFSHTGRVKNLGSGHVLFSNPAAGVDVEPEGGYCTNIEFIRCRLIDNGGQALVSDRPGGRAPAITKNVRLTACTLWGTTNWAAWVTQPGFLFQDCLFHGAFVHGCDAATAAEATQFRGCTFEDKPYAGRPAMGPFLLFSHQHARQMSFTNCHFVGTHDYFVHATPWRGDSAGFVFRGCDFVANQARPPQGAQDYLGGAIFTGRSVFRDGPRRTAPVRTEFHLGSDTVAARTALLAPGRLEFLSRNAYYLVQGKFDVGRQPVRPQDSARVVVGAANVLALHAKAPGATELYIGPSSRVIVKKDGALELRRYTRIVVAGRLEVEKGAYFYSDPEATVSTVGRGMLLVSPGALRTKHPTLAVE